MSDLVQKKLETSNFWLDQLVRSQIIVYYLYKETSIVLHLLITPRLFPVVKVLILSDHNEHELAEVHLGALSTWLTSYAKRSYGVTIPEIVDLDMNTKLLKNLQIGLDL